MMKNTVPKLGTMKPESHQKPNSFTMVTSFKTLINVLTFAPFFFASFSTFSQIPNQFGYHDYKKKYPNESFIILEITQTQYVDIRNGQPLITSENFEKILYLEKNAQNSSKRSVGYDQFTTINKLQALCFYPEIGKYKKEKVKTFTDQEALSTGISFYDES